MSKWTELEEAINTELSKHHPRTGMVVSSGVTCECGYWTGIEHSGITRPVGVNYDQLNWHRAQVIASLVGGENK